MAGSPDCSKGCLNVFWGIMSDMAIGAGAAAIGAGVAVVISFLFLSSI